jgi:hypothetical protein
MHKSPLISGDVFVVVLADRDFASRLPHETGLPSCTVPPSLADNNPTNQEKNAPNGLFMGKTLLPCAQGIDFAENSY